MGRPFASHRELRRYGCPQLLGATRPASLLARLFTSSPLGASARHTSTRLDGLTDRAKGPPIGFPSSSDLRSNRKAVAGSFWKANIPMSYDVAPAMRRLEPSTPVY